MIYEEDNVKTVDETNKNNPTIITEDFHKIIDADAVQELPKNCTVSNRKLYSLQFVTIH